MALRAPTGGMTWALRDEQWNAMIEAMADALAHHSSQVTELLRGGQVNDVLFAGLVVLNAGGLYELDFSVAMATCTVTYLAPVGTVTIVAGTGQGQVPNVAAGNHYPGVHQLIVPASLSPATRTFPVTSGALTFYGPASAVLDVVVMATIGAPSPG